MIPAAIYLYTHLASDDDFLSVSNRVIVASRLPDQSKDSGVERPKLKLSLVESSASFVAPRCVVVFVGTNRGASCLERLPLTLRLRRHTATNRVAG